MSCYWYKSNNVEPTAPYWPTGSQINFNDKCDLMLSIQRLLRDIGWYGGAVDSRPGTVTATSIQLSLRPGAAKGFTEDDGAYTGNADGYLGYNSAVALQKAARFGGYQGPIDGDPRNASWTGYRNWLQGLYNAGYRV